MKKYTGKNARHGDLVFTKLDKKVTGTKTKKPLILAEGEFTGHAHKITPGVNGTIVFKDLDETSKEFEVVGAPAVLTHEEHEAIEFAPGVYKIEIQEEYDYFERHMRTVRD